MKRIPALLGLFLAFCSVSHASTNSYGAWWQTTAGPQGARGAGALLIHFEGDVYSNSGTGGTVTVTMTYNRIGESYVIPGHYNRRDGSIVFFEATPPVLNYFTAPAWHGRLNLLTGQCDGTWKNPSFRNGIVYHRPTLGRFISNIRRPITETAN